ncbi:hypothetical protein OSTOST_05691 [Ostertagia ostertagi]
MDAAGRDNCIWFKELNSLMSSRRSREENNINTTTTTLTKGYNSRKNGAASRAIGNIQRFLKKKIEFPEYWDVLLPSAPLIGRSSFKLDQCHCSRSIRVGDLVSMVPQAAREETVACVLDAARIFATWWDTSSISLEVQRIVDKSFLAINPEAIGASLQKVVLQFTDKSLISGWQWDTTKTIEFGWSIACQPEWSDICLTVEDANEHPRVVVAMPEVLHRLQHCLSTRTRFFYYKSFKDIRTTNNNLFC